MNNNSNKGNFKSPNFNNHKDKQLSERLQNVINRNRSLPNTGTSFNNEENQEQNQNALNRAKEQVQTKATAKAITAATGGLINGKIAEEAAKLALKGLEKKKRKIKLYLIAAGTSIGLLFFIFIGIFAIANDNTSKKSSLQYTTGEITEDELIDELMYYGYCNSKAECKTKGSYTFYKDLKEVYDYYYNYNYKMAKLNQPPDLIVVSGRYRNFKTPINTALLLETINYYQKQGMSFDYYDDGSHKKQQSTTVWGKISSAFQKFMEKMTNSLGMRNNDIKHLAWSLMEYIHEDCWEYIINEKGEEIRVHRDLYYFQISHDKYISYLAYGTTSSHPNFDFAKKPTYSFNQNSDDEYPRIPKAKMIKNDICVGPHNDTVASSSRSKTYVDDTLYDSEEAFEVEGNTLGSKIAKYALQFVGNPYAEGGESLADGVDSSGFTMKVFEHFDINLPHDTSGQYTADGGKDLEKDLDKLLPGDLLVSEDFVGIYIGDYKMVGAVSPEGDKDKKGGIIVSNIPDDLEDWLGIVRYWKK